MKIPTVKLASKTIALLTAIVSTVLVSAGFLLLHYHEESLKRTIFEALDGQVRIAAHGIETVIGDGLRETEAIAAFFPVQALEKGDFAQVESYLERMLTTYPRFGNGIFVLSLEGSFLADFPAHPDLRGQSFAYREYYQRTIREGRGIIGKPYRSRRTKQPVLTYTALIRDGEGRAVAVLACSLDLLSKQALGGYRTRKFGRTGYLYIFDKSRLLILHPDDQRLLTQVEPGRNRLLEAALSGFAGSGETVNSQGVPMLLSVSQVPVIDWIVALQVPRAEAYAPVEETRFRFLRVAGGAVVLVISIGAVAVRRVTRPLRQLERMAVEISADLAGAGETGIFAPDDAILAGFARIRSGDEIGLLASAFSRLVATLKQAFGSLQRSAEDWQRTFDSVNEAVVTLDGEGRVMRMNRAAEDRFRTSVTKVLGQYGYKVIFGTVPPPDWPDIASLKERRRVRWSQRLENPPGVFEFTVTSVTGPEGASGAVLVVSDVTERVESEEQIRRMAFFDQLTGLPNRFLLHDRFQQAAAAAMRSGRRAGVMFIDLDKFKEINDLLGHDVGDDVLRRVSARIAECLRKNDTLSRLGGDEFVAVLCEIESSTEAGVIAARIIEAQAVPLEIGDRKVAAGSSIGIAFYPDDGEDLETLLKKADTAMYSAKAAGRNGYRYYDGGGDPGGRQTGSAL